MAHFFIINSLVELDSTKLEHPSSKKGVNCMNGHKSCMDGKFEKLLIA